MATAVELIKLFGMTSQLIEQDLGQIEKEYAVDLRRDFRSVAEQDEAYYPQIEGDIRAEAAEMAPHYEVFYSLETSIRRLVKDTLLAEDASWWSNLVPQQIRTDAEKRKKKEVESGITPRSEDPLDFTNFGELGQIIIANWAVFGASFSSPKAVERVMANLNTLRGPIAHCSPLAPDEIVRLRLSVQDWFRLAE